MKREETQKNTALKVLLTVILGVISIPALQWALIFILFGEFIYAIALLVIPAIIPVLWLKKKKVYIISSVSFFVLILSAVGITNLIRAYEEKITIDVAPAINTSEYLPFDENSKIVKYDSKTLKFYKDLPRIDGAAAAFPVYSSFVNAVYPKSTRLYDGTFEYNNTVEGYRLLAQKETDIFIGAKPSKEQIAYALECGTTFEYTQIGSEAFVFFVHKDNPIESLTAEQIRGIYSGEITNWKEVGGANERIIPFQRNEGSGSQSMLVRFMGDTPLMKPKTRYVSGDMGGIIEEVADYQSKKGSIGFSFRYYVEGIVKNPDIKLIAINRVAPTVENIKNNSYPIIAPLYAVTYAQNTNENVDKLVEWILSDEGQYIIEATGYVGIK